MKPDKIKPDIGHLVIIWISVCGPTVVRPKSSVSTVCAPATGIVVEKRGIRVRVMTHRGMYWSPRGIVKVIQNNSMH